MDYQDYMDLGYAIKEELRKDVNGQIRFLIFQEDDAMTIDIEYRDFKYRKILVGISDKLLFPKEVCAEIMEDYKEKILNMYFKSEFKKKREEEKRSVFSV